MRIIIKSIPHASHRYPTCGDWWYDEGDLEIRVSEELPEKSQQLVVLHELAEVFMCAAAGVTQEQVDRFDMTYEENRKEGDDSEPGDHTDAPYFEQHQIATFLERLAAYQMGVSWVDHEASIVKLFE